MENKIENQSINQKKEIETIIAYAQLVHYTLQHSKAEINPKSIRNEVIMFYKKFGNDEIIKLTKSLIKNI